ncbi:PTS sugar transporter subunit IIA [Absiella sp. AM29-15]|uniref:PTS sugar transporter subunit IIA n=1 Tax=Absiella sp. AM29-15 TaxID=2292278 RepID=UPI000E4047F1|nr:PTS fructose transporter subunit IIA [Absiella sp. AM29-15]RGC53787.1 PTS fructose transporter subunit IIA [Absiella sp. AM29-15]
MQDQTPWIITITHGHLGEEMVKSAEMLMGKIKNIKSISLLPEESPEELAGVVAKELDGIPGNSLILTDLFGGTPSNVSALFAKKGYYVMTGTNLPILLEAEMYRARDDWEHVVEYLTQIGKDSIVNVNERIEKK